MKSRSHDLSQKAQRALSNFGENLRLARLRRRYSAKMVSERAGISHTTLRRVEKGIPSVTIGVYLQVMFVLGLEAEIEQLGQDDQLGRKIQDAELGVRRRAPKRKTNVKGDEQ